MLCVCVLYLYLYLMLKYVSISCLYPGNAYQVGSLFRGTALHSNMSPAFFLRSILCSVFLYFPANLPIFTHGTAVLTFTVSMRRRYAAIHHYCSLYQVWRIRYQVLLIGTAYLKNVERNTRLHRYHTRGSFFPSSGCTLLTVTPPAYGKTRFQQNSF